MKSGVLNNLFQRKTTGIFIEDQVSLSNSTLSKFTHNCRVAFQSVTMNEAYDRS